MENEIVHMKDKTTMFNEFVVQVSRYQEDNSGMQIRDGWFYSKVFAIQDRYFLVYDDGSFSMNYGTEYGGENGFEWVDFTEMIPKNAPEQGYEPKVRLYKEKQ